MNANTLGYIYNTGSSTADAKQFQQLVTIDAPSTGDVISSSFGRQGLYLLSEAVVDAQYVNSVDVLPEPGGKTDIPYATAPKMTYIWRSKKFVMPGRTTFSVCKVVHKGGHLRLRIIVDGCCMAELQICCSAPFTLPSQMAGIEFEFELIGTARVEEFHVAQSMRELLENG